MLFILSQTYKYTYRVMCFLSGNHKPETVYNVCFTQYIKTDFTLYIYIVLHCRKLCLLCCTYLVVVWVNISDCPPRERKRERIRDGEREIDSSRMHKGCLLWDAGHSWVVNNTRVNHPQAPSHTNTHAYCIHRHTWMHSDICMHPHLRAYTCIDTKMQSENNVYWWRVSECVKLHEELSIRSLWSSLATVRSTEHSPAPRIQQCFLVTTLAYTHKHTHLCTAVSSHFLHTLSTVSYCLTTFIHTCTRTHHYPPYLFMILLQLSSCSVTTCHLLHHIWCTMLWHDLIPYAFCQF